MKIFLRQIGRPAAAGVFTALVYFSGLLLFLTPLPLFYLSWNAKKREWFFGFFFAFAAGFLFNFVILPENLSLSASEIFLNFCYYSYYLCMAFVLSLGVWNRWRLEKMGGVSTFTISALAVIGALFIQRFGFADIQGLFQSFLAESSKMLDQMVASQPQEKQAEMLFLAAQTKEWLALLPKLFPSIVFVATLLTVILNIGIPRLLYRASKPMKWVGDFKRLQIPPVALWALITGGALYFLDAYYIHVAWLKIAAVNLAIASACVYFLQGLSIMAFFLKRYSLLFRFGIYGLLILFFQMVGLVVVGLGLADTWIDFRKLQKKGMEAK